MMDSGKKKNKPISGKRKQHVTTRLDGPMEKDHIIPAKTTLNAALLRARKIRASFGAKTFSDSADLIREDRSR